MPPPVCPVVRDGFSGRTSALRSIAVIDRCLQLRYGIKGSELYIFEDCSHAPLYENVAAFNEKTLAFLTKHAD